MSKATIEQVFEVDPDLKLREELLSITAMNPFSSNCSSARLIMKSSHLSQSLTINNGDEKIIQSGLEKQFSNNTFSKKIDKDARVLKVIPRYRGVGVNTVSNVTEILVIVEYLEDGYIDAISVPDHHTLHQYFGFKYKWNNNILNQLMPGTILSKDTILADSPAVSENGGYKYGANANLALMSIPETSEDGIVISKSFSEKMSYTIFETRVVEFGSKNFPLNIYGNKEVYKPFPEIGEMINVDSVLMALRDYDSSISPALVSANDVMNYDVTFDKCVYVKGPGEIHHTSNGTITSGKVVDIIAYSSPRYKKDTYTGTIDIVEKYVSGYKKYLTDIIDTYEELTQEHYRRYKNNDVKLTERFHRLIVDAYAVANVNNNKIGYTARNEVMDLYRLEIKIEYTISSLPIGSKLSDGFGSKGVVVSVVDDDKMPITKDGKHRADVIMDPGSVVSRMNPGRIYEQYFNGSSRKTKELIIDAVGGYKKKYTDNELLAGYSILLEYLSIFDNEQYHTYKSITDIKTISEIITECVNKEVFILYRISSDKKAYQIVHEIRNSRFSPTYDTIYYNGKETKHPIMIAPVYTIVLSKTADNYLSTASAKTNHYGLPIGAGNVGRNRIPWRNSPTKTISETESRLYVSYVSRLALAELKDRANSIITHEHVCNTILNADIPSNIDRVVDRNVVDYGNDVALQLVENIFNSGGISIDYVKDNNIIHPVIK